MRFGIVKFFDLAQGYGLIVPDDGREDVIVRQEEIDRARLGQIAERQKLGFDVTDGARGAQAVNLWAPFGGR